MRTKIEMKILPVVLVTFIVFSSAIAFVTETLACDGDEVKVIFTVTQNWGSGFQSQVTITNYASWTIKDWVLDFDFPYSITNIWDATIQSHEGDHYVIENAGWNNNIGPDGTASFGFIGAPGGEVGMPTNGQLNKSPFTFNECSSAPSKGEPVEPPPWPDRFFAPYVDATGWPPFDLVQTAQDENVKFFMLGFIVAKAPGDCTPSWGTYYDINEGFLLSDINEIRGMEGDVMVSFGGAANTPLAAACNNVDNLKNAYQSVIDAYNLTHIDSDVEGAWIADAVSFNRRSQAIAALQADAATAGRELCVWYTLPVLPAGLTQDGLNVLQSALDNSVEIAGVNIMAMDYGDGETWLPYQLVQDASVTIHIYNIRGQLVRSLNFDVQKAGMYTTKEKAAYWDGRNQTGERVSNGVYFYTLKAGKVASTRRMLVVK